MRSESRLADIPQVRGSGSEAIAPWLILNDGWTDTELHPFIVPIPRHTEHFLFSLLITLEENMLG